VPLSGQTDPAVRLVDPKPLLHCYDEDQKLFCFAEDTVEEKKGFYSSKARHASHIVLWPLNRGSSDVPIMSPLNQLLMSRGVKEQMRARGLGILTQKKTEI
jgi:hypothetical protein